MVLRVKVLWKYVQVPQLDVKVDPRTHGKDGLNVSHEAFNAGE